MSSDQVLEKLVEQCKSNDVDVKISATNKLQAEFEAGAQINDPDGVINALKTCLRTSNQQLSTAVLAALPPFLPLVVLKAHGSGQTFAPRPASASTSTSSTAASVKGDGLIDVVTLRQVIHAFLPTGGVIERLGDSREKSRENARDTLILLGGFAFRSGTGPASAMSSKSGKQAETPMSLFEKFMREGGLVSKVWRTREQAIVTLVHIRRAHHQFPLKPYLSSLVDTLEDTDAHVRECARISVVELFTGPAVSDGARADLKKEMTKKGVRKAIVDGVEAKLMGGGIASYPPSEGSEAGDGRKEYQPPSVALMNRKASSAATPVASSSLARSHGPLARTASQSSAVPSRPASSAANLSEYPATPVDSGSEVKSVYIASSRDLENEFANMVKAHDGKENEFNWADRERAVLRVRGMIKGDVHTRYPETFLTCLKDNYIHLSLKALASLRTTVSAHACALYAELAVALGSAFDPFCETLYTYLLKMAGFTKKIAAAQSQNTITAMITHCSAQPRILLPLLWNTLQDKTVAARAFVIGHFRKYIEVHVPRSKHSIETSGGLDILEKAMKRSLADPNPAVRDQARAGYWVFESIWPDRGKIIMDSLDNVARKQLEKTCPNPDVVAAVSAVPKNVKKSSVAAAIAASRAKAKAIATAPPTLRHQATSTSHAVRATSPPAKMRPTSPVIAKTRPSSPASPKAQAVSNSVQRSASAGTVPTTSRSPPHRAASPPSPTVQSNFRRRTSSPLAPAVSSSTSNGSSTHRRAIQTALPSSPSSPPSTRTTLTRPSPTSYRSTPTTTTARKNMPVPVFPRQGSLAGLNNEDESLLLATAVPLPDHSDESDFDESVNLMSFSAPFEMYRAPPAQKPTHSPPQSFSPNSNGSRNALLSNGSGSAPDLGQPVVEDALRARAEQAESAAERLLELVDSDEEGSHYPASLLNGTTATPKPKPKTATPAAIRTNHHGIPPVTPVNRNAAILRQAALFQNSPAYNGAPAAPASLMDVMKVKKNETGWWLKRVSLIDRRPRGALPGSAAEELQRCITGLEQGSADVDALKRLAIICADHRVDDGMSPLGHEIALPSSPSPFNGSNPIIPLGHEDFWLRNKTFEKALNALVKYMVPSLGQAELEHALIALWEMLENQSPYIEGREADIFYLLLDIRYCNKADVLEATNTVRDALTTRIEPVYGLTTMHASIRTFHTAAPPDFASAETKAATYAFGLIALGKFILRLPDEILDEELPRLKNTLISALNDKTSLVVRESAASSIIAAQLVLRDETQLFSLLEGLADEKKNLLTYLFDKHGARGLEKSRNGHVNGNGDLSTVVTSVEKLKKEMQRLDNRTSTPPRPTR